MGAARYIGRVGGLAVALGVGMAILTGYGVASAESGSDESGSATSSSASSESTSSGSADSNASAASGVSGSTGAPESTQTSSDSSTGGSTQAESISGAASTTRRATRSAPPGVVVSTGGALTSSATSGSDGSDGTADGEESTATPEDSASTTQPTPPSPAADSTSQASPDPSTYGTSTSPQSTGDTSGEDATPGRTSKTGALSSKSASVIASTASSPTVASNNVNPSISTATNEDEDVVETSLATAWLSSPRALAGRTAAPDTTLSISSTEPSGLVTSGALMTMQAAPPVSPLDTPTTPISVESGIVNLVTAVLDPFAGGGPAAPVDSPADAILAAVARRELFTAPITYAPTITLTNGVITGTNNGQTSLNGNPLTFTVLGAPSAGGKVLLDPATGNFSFLPDLSVVNSAGTETFNVYVSETTPLVAALSDIPLLGALVQPTVMFLQQVPILGGLLAPIIGYAITQPIEVNVGQLAAGNPVAFTTMVTSFDGTQISVNYFPASGLQAGEKAPTILNGPGLGSAGNTDPNSLTIVDGLVPGLVPLRDGGYNVVTWDPRGEFASGGVLQLDSPEFEARDVSAIIDWVVTQPTTEFPTGSTTDPLLGMVGGSYGGGIQWVTAASDPRVDAIVPVISWHTLNSSLYPTQAFKTAWSALLLAALVEVGARINPELYSSVITGSILGVLTPSAQDLLTRSGPGDLVSNITIPTFLIQGTADGLFPLQQSINNAQLLVANGVETKMLWVCGGHGVCLDPINPGQEALIVNSTLAWLDKHVKGENVDTGRKFEWVDQAGQFYSSDKMPFETGFNGGNITASGAGGFLPILPIVGGSGPQDLTGYPLPAGTTPLEEWLLSFAIGSPATNAVDLDVSPSVGTQIVGAPTLTLTYSGLGTSRHVYAQIVDKQTGLVLGGIVTPIPVTLDGQTRTVTVPLEAIAYTAPPGAKLTLQVVSTATPYLNVLTFGGIHISSMQLVLPTVGANANVRPEFPSASASEPLVLAGAMVG
jgi:ABC-2 type transport system ATP-binding protein